MFGLQRFHFLAPRIQFKKASQTCHFNLNLQDLAGVVKSATQGSDVSDACGLPACSNEQHQSGRRKSPKIWTWLYASAFQILEVWYAALEFHLSPVRSE